MIGMIDSEISSEESKVHLWEVRDSEEVVGLVGCSFSGVGCLLGMQ